MICCLLSINFLRYQKFLGKQNLFCTKIFVSVLWNKWFWQNRDALPLPMHENFSWNVFSETPQCSPINFFGTVRQKFFDGTTWYPLLWIKFFDTQNFLKPSRDAHKSFRHCETQIFQRKTWYAPFNPQNFSKTETFSKTVSFPYEIFRYCETWKFWLKIVICALLSINFFRNQKFSGKQKVSFTKSFVSVLWNKKFWQNRDALPLTMHEKFC